MPNASLQIPDCILAGSERFTGALLDRITHHVHIFEMNGESYRVKQSRSQQTTKARLPANTACPSGSTGPTRARRRVSLLRGTPRRARGPPMDYVVKLRDTSPGDTFLHRHTGGLLLRR